MQNILYIIKLYIYNCDTHMLNFIVLAKLFVDIDNAEGLHCSNRALIFNLNAPDTQITYTMEVSMIVGLHACVCSNLCS